MELTHPKTKKLIIARDVVFFENVFPGIELSRKNEAAESLSESLIEEAHTPMTNAPTINLQGQYSGSDADEPADGEVVSEGMLGKTAPMTSNVTEDEDSSNETVMNKRRSARNHVPNKLIFSDDFVIYHAKISSSDPKTVKEALESLQAEHWKRAMEKEIAAHAENGTWMSCDVANTGSIEPITCKWVFKTKLDVNGKVERYKARLVARGFTRCERLAYEETFSPVVRYSSIRFLLALAAKFGLDIDQMDVITAFLNPELEEELYVKLPDEYPLMVKFAS